MTFSTALGFGAMFGLLFSITEIRHHFKLAFSLWTILGFVLGAVLGWLFWRTVRLLEDKASNASRKSDRD
jgi:hypothetical protein